MEEYDLVRVLGILLDNAYEEAGLTDRKKISVGIIENNEKVIIFIENSCRESIPDTEMMTEYGFSSKGDGRGIGLANFKEILRSYPNCCYQMGRKEEADFYVRLELSRITS